MTTINFASAACGQGKTYSACEYIFKNLSETNHLYVAPTKKLIDQTQKELIKLGFKPDVIHTDNTANVHAEVMAYLKKASTCGNVLMITWSTYINLKHFQRRYNWKVIIDEVPQLDNYYALCVPHNYSHLSDHLKVVDAMNDTMGIVKAINPSALKSHLDKKVKKDELYSHFQELYSDVLNKYKTVFVDLKSWGAICEKHQVSKTEEENTVHFISLLNANAFDDSIILGANIERSMFHHWMTKMHDVNFIEHQPISSSLRPAAKLGHRVEVAYFLKNQPWSKHVGKKEVDGSTILEQLEQSILKEIGDKRFLLVANNDYKGCLASQPNCTRIPVDSKGLNQYQGHTTIVNIAALNRTPKHSQLLKRLGFDDETIRISTSYEYLYQNIMRTALRDPDSTETVTVITPSEFEADHLIGLLSDESGIQKKQIGDVKYKKYKPLTAQEKNNNTKFKKIMNEVIDKSMSTNRASNVLLFPSDHLKNDDHLLYIQEDGNQKSHDSHVNKCHVTSDGEVEQGHPTTPGYIVALNNDIHDVAPEQFVECDFETIHEFVKFLRQASKHTISSKSDNHLLNPITYHVDDEGKYRKKENFKQASMMVLDFDGGNLSPDDFIRIFHTEAAKGQKRSFVIANSFSRSPENPNRFRVFLFYKTPAQTLEQHQAVYWSLMERFKDSGFTETDMKCDRSVIHGVQPFYLPCTNRDHPESYLFEKCNVGPADIERCGIDPVQTSRTASKKSDVLVVRAVNSDTYLASDTQRQDLIEKYIAEILGMTSDRRIPFFVLGRKLQSLGLSLEDIYYHLTNVERQIEKTKQKWAQAVMATLRKAA